MSNPEGRSLARDFNAWVQTFGILIAAGWGAYTFVYKEIVVPKSAPINITLDLGLKKIGSGTQRAADTKRQLIPVEIKVSAKNPSSRTVYLLPSAWLAYGNRISATEEPEAVQDFQITSETRMDDKEMHTDISESDLVGVGGLFGDTVLQPNEVTTRTMIIYVPSSKYDEIVVSTFMPTVAKDRAVDLEWKLNEKTHTLDVTMYRLDKKGARKEMKRDPDGGYSDPTVELQMAASHSQLSLWQ